LRCACGGDSQSRSTRAAALKSACAAARVGFVRTVIFDTALIEQPHCTTNVKDTKKENNYYAAFSTKNEASS
jgi:hypothetical protein